MPGFTFADDVTRAFISSAPAGVNLCGYTTGTNGIAWGMADWAAHPFAVRIDQDWGASDQTADVLDAEAGAAPFTVVALWVGKALLSLAAGTRPGQRLPAVYCSLSNVPAVTGALAAGGFSGGIGLWIADWTNDQVQAEAMIGTTYGGFPVIGVQYRDAGAYDMDVFDTAWWSGRVQSLPSFPLRELMTDRAPAGLIRTLQGNLNRWAVILGLSPLLAADGSYGPLTAAAVTLAQVFFGERGVPAGICDQAVFSDLAGAVPPVFPAPAGLGAVVADAGQHVTASWAAVKGAAGYHFQLEWYKNGFGWVMAADKATGALSDTEALPDSVQFRWRVRVQGGYGTWSPWVAGQTAA